MRPVTILALIALATAGFNLVSASAPSCRASDHTGGMGGQDVSCAFTCGGGETVSVKVHAMDADASVSGAGDCGTAVVSCSGSQDCGSEDVTESAGGGSCEGHSSEFWDSGLEVSCESRLGGERPDVPLCPIPVIRCVVSTGKVEFNSCDVAPTVPTTPSLWRTRTPDLGSPLPCIKVQSPHARIWMARGVAVGWTCASAGCFEVVPSCVVDASGWTCRIGASA